MALQRCFVVIVSSFPIQSLGSALHFSFSVRESDYANFYSTSEAFPFERITFKYS